MRIHITTNGQQQGPYSIDEINSLIASGQLPVRDTLAWYEGCQDWIELASVPGVPIATSAQPPPPPVRGGTRGTVSEIPTPTQKPQKIKNAVLMLWISLGLGVVRSVWEIPAQAAQTSVGFVVFVIGFTFLFVGFFVWMIGKGKNWARITFLVLFILGVPLSILPLIQSLAYAPISSVLGISQSALQTVAVIFLFLKESSAWFKLQKAANH